MVTSVQDGLQRMLQESVLSGVIKCNLHTLSSKLVLQGDVPADHEQALSVRSFSLSLGDEAASNHQEPRAVC